MLRDTVLTGHDVQQHKGLGLFKKIEPVREYGSGMAIISHAQENPVENRNTCWFPKYIPDLIFITGCLLVWIIFAMDPMDLLFMKVKGIQQVIPCHAVIAVLVTGWNASFIYPEDM